MPQKFDQKKGLYGKLLVRLSDTKARLNRELLELKCEPISSICIATPAHKGGIFNWQVSMIAPEKYRGSEKILILNVQFLADYPLSPPIVTFHSKVRNPCVSQKDGAIKLPILAEKWKPTFSISKVLTKIH